MRHGAGQMLVPVPTAFPLVHLPSTRQTNRQRETAIRLVKLLRVSLSMMTSLEKHMGSFATLCRSFRAAA